jgi:glutamyl-tRNA synthetase
MATTHVIRGDEWLPSLPKHALLFRAFGWEPPAYAHLALLLNTQHKKLSKRDGDVSVSAFLAWCLPDALVNFIALLGWNPSADRDLYTLPELIATFDLAAVNRSPAVVDFTKLEWMNGEYIRQRSPSELLAAMRAAGSTPSGDDAFLLRVLAIEQPRLKRLDALPDWYFKPVVLGAVPLAWKQTDRATTRQNLELLAQRLETIDPWPDTPSEFEAIIKPWIVERGFGVGEMLWPMRVALSGQKASPSPFELAWLFGRMETLQRISYAIQSLA